MRPPPHVLRCRLVQRLDPTLFTPSPTTKDLLTLRDHRDRLEVVDLVSVEGRLQDLLDVPTRLVAVLREEERVAIALQPVSPLNHDVPLAAILG